MYPNSNKANPSIIEGYSPEQGIKNIVFEGLKITGTKIFEKYIKHKHILLSDFEGFIMGYMLTDLSINRHKGEEKY